MAHCSLDGMSGEMISWVSLFLKNCIISSFSSHYYNSIKGISKEKQITPNSMNLFYYIYN